MNAFAELVAALSCTPRQERRVERLRHYLASATSADATWALSLLWGETAALPVVATRQLVHWAAAEMRVPLWLSDQCRELAGDLAETAALLLPWPTLTPAPALHRLMEAWRGSADPQALLVNAWRRLEPEARLVLNRLVSGGWSIPVARSEIVAALAAHGELPQAIVAQRLARAAFDPPRPEMLSALLAPVPETAITPLAWNFPPTARLSAPAASLGEASHWMAEWLWPGWRVLLERTAEGAQILLADGTPLTDLLPEVVQAAQPLPPGTRIEAVLVSWGRRRPGPVLALEKRLKASPRKRARAAPVALLALDAIRFAGRDLQAALRHERRRLLAELLTPALRPQLWLSEELAFSNWAELEALWRQARCHGAGGVVLTRRAANYRDAHAIRRLWPAPPLEIEAVLLYIQTRPVNEYAFGLWRGDELVTVARTGEGLDAAEWPEWRAAIQQQIKERRGAFTLLRPALVVTLAFDAVHPSARHKSAVVLEHPRMLRWQRATPAAAADSLAHLQAMIRELGDIHDHRSPEGLNRHVTG